MKLKHLPHALILALAAASAASAQDSAANDPAAQAAAAAAAAAAAHVSPHASDLYAILFALPFYEGMAYAKLPAGSYNHAMRDYYLRHVSKEELIARMVPGMTAIVPPALAARVAANMREPAYRKRMKSYVVERTGAGDAPDYLTAEELAVLKRIDNEQSSKDFAARMPQISELVRKTMADSREALEVKLARQALATIETTQGEIAQVNKTGRPVAIRTIGFEPWDQIIRAVGNSTLKMALTFYRFNSELDRLQYADLVQAPSVVRRHNYGEVAALVDQAEDALATSLKELDAAIKEREQDISQSEFANVSQFRSKLDEVTAGLYTFAGDLGEAYRNLFAAQRQMVAFLQEHKTSARLEGEKIVFDDDASVATMNDIFKRILAAARDVEGIVDRQTARENAELDKVRNKLSKSGK